MSGTERILTPVQKMLLGGADYLEKWGHWKGSYFHTPHDWDFEGSLFPSACLMGSLQAVRAIEKGVKVMEFDGDHLVREGEHYMNHYLKVNDCTAWNDQEERSAAEVIQSLRDAAAAYKEEDKWLWDMNAREKKEAEESKEYVDA